MSSDYESIFDVPCELHRESTRVRYRSQDSQPLPRHETRLRLYSHGSPNSRIGVFLRSRFGSPNSRAHPTRGSPAAGDFFIISTVFLIDLYYKIGNFEIIILAQLTRGFRDLKIRLT